MQITPQLLPNSQTVLLDLSSSVTKAEISAVPFRFLGGDPTESVKTGDNKAQANNSGMNLDRVNVVIGKLATTVIVPLGEPTLVGGLTREPSSNEQESAADTPQLYLFIEATAK
jgi:type II secretory pathway component GspD/PulD (secretin)